MVVSFKSRWPKNLNGAQIRTCFEQVSGKTMPQRMRMDAFLDVRSLGGVMTRMPNGFRIDGLITAVAVVAGKSHLLGFRRRRRQCARSSSSSTGLSMTSRSLRSLPPWM